MAETLAAQDRSQAAEPVLSINNIEVIYDHVILVLKGVSLEVPLGGITALAGCKRRRQDNDP
jgi:branched-chain amino acid transport system ATP-binding protein